MLSNIRLVNKIWQMIKYFGAIRNYFLNLITWDYSPDNQEKPRKEENKMFSFVFGWKSNR